MIRAREGRGEIPEHSNAQPVQVVADALLPHAGVDVQHILNNPTHLDYARLLVPSIGRHMRRHRMCDCNEHNLGLHEAERPRRRCAANLRPRPWAETPCAPLRSTGVPARLRGKPTATRETAPLPPPRRRATPCSGGHRALVHCWAHASRPTRRREAGQRPPALATSSLALLPTPVMRMRSSRRARRWVAAGPSKQ